MKEEASWVSGIRIKLWQMVDNRVAHNHVDSPCCRQDDNHHYNWVI
ncbi:MAG: hypothetical protein ACOX6E_00515 [Syntrophomonadaceae bacterium]